MLKYQHVQTTALAYRNCHNTSDCDLRISLFNLVNLVVNLVNLVPGTLLKQKTPLSNLNSNKHHT